MLEAGLPRIELPALVFIEPGALGGFPPIAIGLQPFGVLVATGVGLGSWLSLRETRRLGASLQVQQYFILTVLLAGFAGAHMLNVVAYRPWLLAEDPWSWLKPWHGMSSMGGILGALVGAMVWRRVCRRPLLPQLDLVAMFFPLGMAFGRAGCAVVHDHPGIQSDSWLAIPFGNELRLDLGLLELLLLLPIAALFAMLRRRRRPWGFYAAWFALLYAPARFVLDFQRAQIGVGVDPRYWGLTPAQWLCPLFVLAGVVLLVRLDSTLPEAFKIPANRRGLR